MAHERETQEKSTTVLPPDFARQFQQLMKVKIGMIDSEARAKFSTRSAEFAMRGHLAPANLGTLYHENAVWRIKQLVHSALEVLQRVLSAFNPQYSEQLSLELKTLIE